MPIKNVYNGFMGAEMGINCARLELVQMAGEYRRKLVRIKSCGPGTVRSVRKS